MTAAAQPSGSTLSTALPGSEEHGSKRKLVDYQSALANGSTPTARLLTRPIAAGVKGSYAGAALHGSSASSAPVARSNTVAPVAKSSGFAAAFEEDDEEELDESDVLGSSQPAPVPQAQAVVAAPAEDNGPVALPKKTIVKKKVVTGAKA